MADKNSRRVLVMARILAELVGAPILRKGAGLLGLGLGEGG